MISNNRADYSSASEWLSALRQDELWQCQLQQLQNASPDDAGTLRDRAYEKIGKGEAYGFWDSYNHQVEPVVREVWDIAAISLANLKIQTIGMLSVGWLEQHLETGAAKSARKTPAKKTPRKPEKPRETMTFKRLSGVTEGHLTLLYQTLVKEGWILGNEADFKALFSNRRDEHCVLTWTGIYGKGTLVELFKQFVASNLIAMTDGYSLPAILAGHFQDSNGHWLTGLDKGSAANDKAMPVIRECVKLMKATPEQLIYGDYADDSEDFKSVYDPYDHQDLNIHKL